MSGEYLGCMAGGCAIEKPKGIHHNGSCHCLDGMDPERRAKLRKAIGRYRSRIDELEKRLEARSGDGQP